MNKKKSLFQVKYSDHHAFYLVYDWVKSNCVGESYSGTSWDKWEIGGLNRAYEFELEEDAFMFKLRWGGQ